MPSADIWSTMCLLIQMLSAEAPWEEYRHQGEGLLFVVSTLNDVMLLRFAMTCLIITFCTIPCVYWLVSVDVTE